MSNKTNISLKPIKVEKKDNTSLGKEASSLKSLVEIANELDRRGLAKEADVLDKLIKEAFIKQAYSWSKFRADFKLLSNQISKDVGSAIDRGEAAVSEAIEGAKEVGRDIQTLYNLGIDKIEESSRKALSAILDNPDVLNALSLITKIGAAGAMAFPEPATTAAGLAVLKGSAAFDILAAIGYFNKGENISGWASIVSAVVTVPAGLVYQAYKGLMLLKSSGSFVILAKAAPAALISAFIVGLEVFIEAVEGGLNKLSEPDSIIYSAINQRQAESGSVDQNKIKRNMETSGRELLAMLTSMKSDLSKA